MTNFQQEFETASHLISQGRFDEASEIAKLLLQIVDKENPKQDFHYILYFNICGQLIDIGAAKPCTELTMLGLNLMLQHKNIMIRLAGPHSYYYNLANAKSNLISNKDPFLHTFESIEEVVELKTYYWKALKSAQADGLDCPEYFVNLANALKQQFRVSEALLNYDKVNSLELDIPQSWINRSETLLMLNAMSDSYSVKMLKEVQRGYEKTQVSKTIPPAWASYYASQANDFKSRVQDHLQQLNANDEDDEHLTDQEFAVFSAFRKFCINEALTLSEHGLYCACDGSARDNLSIPVLEKGLVGDYIPQMEMVLNRLKSEFSFARRQYFEYLFHSDDVDELHESCFSELLNDEMLGSQIEKLRMAFRMCFGILDKIAVAICELYNMHPPKGKIYFESFWQLDKANRRNQFEAIKNPGLLALYSISTDLNYHKDGEWSFFKSWRNALEHGFLVIHENEVPLDQYGTYKFCDDITFIPLDQFLYHTQQLLQITRSAIFSFVFTVRQKSLSEIRPDGRYLAQELHRKDYILTH